VGRQTGEDAMSQPVRPDVERELAKLKAFQRDTVEHVYQRMYRDGNPARRFLVADEVGLGKTMVARGLVAKVIDRLWDDVKRIDVVYICSNGSIARQNIGRLNVSGTRDASLPSRITLLPKVVRGLKSRKLNFISLTPQTSFDLRSSLGTYEERALLYWLLPAEWRASSTAVRNLLQGGADRDRFKLRVQEFDNEDIDDELRDAFRQHLTTDQSDLKESFMTAAARFRVWRDRLPDEDRAVQRGIVGRLRGALATSCLKALEPDLIILDEFQRFKHLLDGTDKAGDLAKDLFSFGDARVLLLSATPYKMYTTAEEIESDDHFRDFSQTVRFLHNDERKTAGFQSSLKRYRDAVFALGAGDGNALLETKDAVENSLREVMVRTERLAVSADRNGMLCEVISAQALAPDEVSSYLTYAAVADALKHSDVTEYWKSAPYLLNFMDDYEFKADFKEAAADPKRASELVKTLASSANAMLPWDDVERYQKLDPANARLRQLVADTLDSGAWRRLWLPASLPYYKTSGPYEGDLSSASKRLIFSSWQVVPKVVAATLSYEAERRMFGDSFDTDRPNTPAARDRLTPRLRGLPLLTLNYPSLTLCRIGDPLRLSRERDGEEQMSVAQVLAKIREGLEPSLAELISEHARRGGAPDSSWYWAAPLLLDLDEDEAGTRKWLAQDNLADIWRRDPESDGQGEDSGAADDWMADVGQFRRVGDGQLTLGEPPPDLLDVLAKVALGGPGVAGLRALSRVLGDDSLGSSIRNNAGWMAEGFRTLFNLPEVTAMLRAAAATTSEDRYWERVLDYCTDGGIQAVLDEYVHVAQEWLGVAFKPVSVAAAEVARTTAKAMQLRTAQVGVDAISVAADTITLTDHRMRARFAARFGARQTDEGAGALRADDVRLAFNSPFWPFVLCSTSVGQEGLDFHLYCHAVVHWNLPSNPVDLEQREGRVHRYKGHAIRKNAARLYGGEALASDARDPWEGVFEAALAVAPDDACDLVPFWILPAKGGSKIERHLPMLPLSREVERADALRKALTVYRMAFGQNRQDDLVAYLTARFPADQIGALSEQLRIDLAPKPGFSRRPPSHQWTRETQSEHEPEGAVGLTRGSVTLGGARTLLDRFAALRVRTASGSVEQYRDLLDRFSSLNK